MTDFADLIITGATVHTLDPRHPHATAVATSGGRIVAVGDDRDVADLRGAETDVIDLAGATLTPGLVDGHMHPVLGLSMADGVDLSGCSDLDAVRAAVHAEAERTPAGEWVRGWGLDPNTFAGRAISSDAIDDVVAGRPALLVIFDGHAALASREALRRAGIDGPREFGSMSVIVCDADGTPTGHLLEGDAMDLVRAVMPEPAFDTTRSRLAELLLQMAASGLTGGHVMDFGGASERLFTSLDEAGELPLRLRAAPWCEPDDDADRIAELIEMQGRRGSLWRIAAVKMFMDGTIDGGTAWLHEPDCHGESTHAYWRDPADYTRAVARFAAAGVQTATHAIGDAAVAHVLTTLGEVVPKDSTVRHRIEHIETLPTDQVRRFVEHGVVASMQPTHATDYSRADHSDNWSQRLGDERANRAWRCRDLVDAGVTLAIGSDWPIAPFDPRGIIAAAQTRRPVAHPELDPVAPEQALTAQQALAAYTLGPAEVAGESREAGRIAVGHRADLTAFALDPLATPAQEFAEAPVLLTVVDGVTRHRHRAI